MTFVMRFWPYILLTLQAILIYGSSLSHPLIYWDDFKHICENNFINPPTAQGLAGIWSTAYFGMYIPVTYTMWALIVAVAQFLWPAIDCIEWGPVFHFFNLAIHAANSILVFRILSKISGRYTGAVLGAVLFCGHPLQVEAVAWASGARDVLSAFFGLFGIICYLNGKKKTANIFMIVAVLAKPSGVVFPFLVILLRLKEWRVHVKSLLPALLGVFVIFLITQAVQGNRVDSPEIGIGFRSLLMLGGMGFYLWKVIWPVGLIPIYSLSINTVLSDPSLLWPAIISLSLFIVFLKFRHKILWSAIIWVLVSWLPISGLIDFGFQGTSIVADRYFYLPMVGISLAMAVCCKKKYQYILAASFMILISIISFRQVLLWKNDETVFKHTIAMNAHAVSAYSSLGFYYMRKHRLIEAEFQFREALDLNRNHLSSWLGLGRVLELQGRANDAEVVYRSAIQNRSAVPEIFNNLGTLLYLRGELAESEKFFISAAQNAPLYMEPKFNLGQIYIDTGRYVDALKILRAAEEIAPGSQLVLSKKKEAQEKLSLD